jgi:hypothetical protein
VTEKKAANAIPLKPGKPKSSDPTTDFNRALEAANNPEGAAPETAGFPALFPTKREDVEERVHEEVPPPGEKGIPSLVETQADNYKARYRRFDLADDKDVADLEEINNHIMKDGWLPGREEWLHTRDGGTYVVLKWLERTKPLKKKQSEKEDTDAILEEFGIGRG